MMTLCISYTSISIATNWPTTPKCVFTVEFAEPIICFSINSVSPVASYNRLYAFPLDSNRSFGMNQSNLLALSETAFLLLHVSNLTFINPFRYFWMCYTWKTEKVKTNLLTSFFYIFLLLQFWAWFKNLFETVN